MTTQEFLAHLRELGVRLRRESGSIHCTAPEGVLTPALQEEIVERKPELLALLETSGEELLRLGRIPRTDRIPPSFAQQRLWFLDQLEPGTSAYTIVGRRWIRGPLDVTQLTRALTELVRRHESLRTTFVSRDGEPSLVVGDPAPVTLDVVRRVLLAEAEQVQERPLADRKSVV